MKTLKNHTIVYDDQCPLCNLYTGAFVKTKMLDKDGRQSYSEILLQSDHTIDKSRSCNEIALINKENNTVDYGIDSLFKVIQYNYPIFKPLFGFSGFRWLMKQFYSVVSYNRKVLMPGVNQTEEQNCVPDFHLGYRSFYLIISWLITSFILAKYTSLLTPLVPASSWSREFFICGGQMLYQSVALGFSNTKVLVNYLGHLMTVSLKGALLLLPMIWISGFIDRPVVFLCYFAIVVSLMLFDHIRRVRRLGLPRVLSLSWVMYRLIVLVLILIGLL